MRYLVILLLACGGSGPVLVPSPEPAPTVDAGPPPPMLINLAPGAPCAPCGAAECHMCGDFCEDASRDCCTPSTGAYCPAPTKCARYLGLVGCKP